jgi:CubicO group peptidase (beta-lactamase class C family)
VARGESRSGHRAVRLRAIVRALAGACTIALAACGAENPPTAPVPATQYFPPVAGAAWETITPAALGWNATALESALTWLGEQNTTAVVILWRGRIVAERYWDGWGPTTPGPNFSAGKVITGHLVGELAAAGAFALDDPVSSVVGAGWSRAAAPDESAVTIRHLLRMASGLDDSLYAATTRGDTFFYNNPAYYQLFDVLQAATGQTMAQLTAARLWNRIGMQNAFWLPNTDTGEPGFIHFSSARDFARFGLLALNGGVWNGTAIHPDSQFLRASRQPSGTTNASYGYLWWLNGQSSHRTPGSWLLPTRTGPLFPGAPTDLAAALGLDDKKLYVVPSLDLVVVRLGPRAEVSGTQSLAAISLFDTEFWARLQPAIGY